jgi:hypothetical protein
VPQVQVGKTFQALTEEKTKQNKSHQAKSNKTAKKQK